jgi:outer membrane protein OmpA-like peptidoglycan-associated protein
MALTALSVSAQDVAKPRYKVSGGLLAGANVYKYKDAEDVDKSDWKSRWGFDGGIWFNLPLGRVFSLEPQVIYSSRGIQNKNNTGGSPDGNANFISVPVLVKVGLGQKLALLAGPQFDFLTSFKDDRNANAFNKDEFKSSNIGFTTGLELFPHNRLSLYGRYNWMTSDFYTGDDGNTGLPTKPDYRLNGFHFGVKFRFFGGAVAAAAAAPLVAAAIPPADTDGDGIPDKDDRCPNQAGSAKYGGCPVPDSDGDGLNDEQDKCPNQAGTAKYQGCPIPDSDGDGINDENDKCPNQAGVASRQGCPIPDTDGDGINDDEDKCPNAAGPADNKGCPIIGIEAYKVVFASGSSTLLPAGKKELDKAVAYLKEHTGFDVAIEGHTDNTGSDKINNPLSTKRAEAVKAYFVKNGIPAERLYPEGFGSSRPIEDNKTVEGRKLNRRIEVKLKH